MKTFYLIVLSVIVFSCRNRHRSYIYLDTQSNSGKEKVVYANGYMKDSIVEFRTCNSYIFTDTLYIELLNNNGWSDRRIHIEIVNDSLWAWESYADDISSYTNKIENIAYKTTVDDFSIGTHIGGELLLISKRENRKIIYKGSFSTTVSSITPDEWLMMCINPNGKRRYVKNNEN